MMSSGYDAFTSLKKIKMPLRSDTKYTWEDGNKLKNISKDNTVLKKNTVLHVMILTICSLLH